MAGPVRACALCLQVAELQKSHLLPRAVYKVMRDGQAENPNPVVITSSKKRPIQSSEQERKHLLCQDCEQLLDKGGEKWVLARMWHRDGRFPLRDQVEAGTMIASGPSALLYDIAGTSVRLDFALGVFWKKAVWPDTTNELGPYAEEIRSFLRGGAFPLRCELTVWVHRKETKLACVAFDPVPLGRTGPGSYGYKFMIPGINFLLSLGADPGELHVGAGRISVCDGDQILLNALRALGPLPDLPGPKRRVVR